MVSRKKALVDLSHDVDGPESPEDTFQVSASLGIFHQIIRGEEGGPIFHQYVRRAQLMRSEHPHAG